MHIHVRSHSLEGVRSMLSVFQFSSRSEISRGRALEILNDKMSYL